MITITISRFWKGFFNYFVPGLMVFFMLFLLIGYSNTGEWYIITFIIITIFGTLSLFSTIVPFNKLECNRNEIIFQNIFRKRTFVPSQFDFFILTGEIFQFHCKDQKQFQSIFFPIPSYRKMKNMELIAREINYKCYFIQKKGIYVFSKSNMNSFNTWMIKFRGYEATEDKYYRID